jgi:malto-oligosyltrehalose trehalohydrolase
VSAAPKFGPLVTADGITFRLWAPAAKSVELLAGETHAMTHGENGWFDVTVKGAKSGARYLFRIDGEIDVPDPASRFQPDDISGPSEVIDTKFDWRTSDWKGRPWHECVFMELHVGTFTSAGTYRGAIGDLDRLADLGITAIELMPLSDFPGRWNWGYDGVLPFAPDSAYGRPEDLTALIDAAHQRGMMVFLDVVYNHFGPEGNYLGRYAPGFFVEAQTPWGSAIDYRQPEVRAFVIENVLHWLSDYRFDGLRFDAVHAIVEPGKPSLLTEISQTVGQLARDTGRHIHLVLENDDNIASLLDPITDPPNGKYRAQWNDDYHHAWHVLLSGESAGYYKDYQDVERHLARTLAEGFAYQGELSVHRKGTPRGKPSASLPATSFVNFLQNHDQIGNRPLGERLSSLAKPAALDAALTITALAPGIPLFFMGDEWGAAQPFPFFCDFKGDLAEAVRAGRKREFAEAYADPKLEVPDPLSEQTVRHATLRGDTRTDDQNQRAELLRRLLISRKSFVTPLLPTIEAGTSRAGIQGGILSAHWFFKGDPALKIFANLSDRPVLSPLMAGPHNWFWGGTPAETLEPWSVHAAIGGH